MKNLDCVKTIEYILNDRIFVQLSYDFKTNKYCVFVFLRFSFMYHKYFYDNYEEAKQVYDFWIAI